MLLNVLEILSYLVTIVVSYWAGGYVVYRTLKKRRRLLDENGELMTDD